MQKAERNHLETRWKEDLFSFSALFRAFLFHQGIKDYEERVRKRVLLPGIELLALIAWAPPRSGASLWRPTEQGPRGRLRGRHSPHWPAFRPPQRRWPVLLFLAVEWWAQGRTKDNSGSLRLHHVSSPDSSPLGLQSPRWINDRHEPLPEIDAWHQMGDSTIKIALLFPFLWE